MESVVHFLVGCVVFCGIWPGASYVNSHECSRFDSLWVLGSNCYRYFLLLVLVALSYAQVAKANPEGGGAYAIAKKNLGEYPALIAAGAVFADYILTAAVSVAAGTAAIISAYPSLGGLEVTIDLCVLFFVLMLVNLRGIRESSNAFVFPTYAFLFGIVVMLTTGAYQIFTQSLVLIPFRAALILKERIIVATIPFHLDK